MIKNYLEIIKKIDTWQESYDAWKRGIDSIVKWAKKNY